MNLRSGASLASAKASGPLAPALSSKASASASASAASASASGASASSSGAPASSSSKDCRGFLYILTNSQSPSGTLKVGRTNDYARRVSQYPKGSKYIEVFGPLEDCHVAERHLLSAMRARFVSSDYGREYFRGNASELVGYFHAFCYERLQPDHMPWMPVPMDVDGAALGTAC